jgi:hypothetical protein
MVTSSKKKTPPPAKKPVAKKAVVEKATTKKVAATPVKKTVAVAAKAAAPAPAKTVTPVAHKAALPTPFKTVTSFTHKETTPAPAKTASVPKIEKPASKHTETVASAPKKSVKKITVSPEERYKMVAEAAYYRAEQRGFATGHETEDWNASEAEIDAMLNA